MITKDELIMGRDKTYPADYTHEISANRDKLLIAVNKLRAAYNNPMYVSSGWRPPDINAATPGSAKRSNHMLGLAVDFKDTDGTIDAWCMANQDKLAVFGLWLEDPGSTIGWCHVQCIAPGSGHRVFKP